MVKDLVRLFRELRCSKQFKEGTAFIMITMGLPKSTNEVKINFGGVVSMSLCYMYYHLFRMRIASIHIHIVPCKSFVNYFTSIARAFDMSPVST